MLDSPLEWVILFAGVAGRARRATFINEQAIKTEADLGSQAGLTLFLLHTKYLGWDKGFPDGALPGAKALPRMNAGGSYHESEFPRIDQDVLLPMLD